MNSIKQFLCFQEMTQAVGSLIVWERFAAGEVTEPESGTAGLLSAELSGDEPQMIRILSVLAVESTQQTCLTQLDHSSAAQMAVVSVSFFALLAGVTVLKMW